jgi:Holliday junction resolvase RusA-like endonuclease
MITFTIPVAPIGKGRPRFGNGRAYTPAKTRAYEATVALYARQVFKRPLTGAIRLQIEFYMPIPASASKARKASLLNRPHVGRPDLDNLAKLVLDGCNGVVYADDGQIALLHVTKWWSDTPRTVVEVRVLP